MKILTIGGATQDVFIQQEKTQTIELTNQDSKNTFLLLQEGSKLEIDSLQYASGGGATNTSVAFKRLGLTVSSFFKVGADIQGTMLLEELNNEGVNTQSCIVDPNGKTGVSYIIASCNAERTVLAYRGLNAQLTSTEIPYKSFKEFSFIYISSLSGSSAELLLPITKKAREDGCRVINNPGINQCFNDANSLIISLPFIDILILNSKEAEQCMLLLLLQENENDHSEPIQYDPTLDMPMLFKTFFTANLKKYTLRDFFKLIKERGPQVIVVTNGNEGVYLHCDDTSYFHPSLKSFCLSTLGAGDALGAAFVAGLALSYSYPDAIRMGIINSSSVIGCLDAKKGLLNFNEMEKKLITLDTSLLKEII